MSSGLKKVNSNLKGRPSTLWTMSVGCPGNGRQPLAEPYTVQWVRWPISYGDQPLTGEPDAGEPPVRFGGRGDSSIVPTPNLREVANARSLRSRRSLCALGAPGDH